MILSATREDLDRAAGRRTPAELASEFKHVGDTVRVVTRLPRKSYAPKHCDGPACVHVHRAGSRPQATRTGRRWIAC